MTDSEREVELQAEPVPGQLAFQEAPVPSSPWRRRLIIGGIVALFLVLSGVGGAAGYLAWTNKDRADRWQARAEALDARVQVLEEVVVERTTNLNRRTTELNRMATKVKNAESAIKRSEADVKKLEKRQRKLASEKADVEDSRAALALEADSLEGIAQAYIDCKVGLTDLLNYVLADNYYAANAIVGTVQSDCDYADSSLDNYVATYG